MESPDYISYFEGSGIIIDVFDIDNIRGLIQESKIYKLSKDIIYRYRTYN